MNFKCCIALAENIQRGKIVKRKSHTFCWVYSVEHIQLIVWDNIFAQYTDKDPVLVKQKGAQKYQYIYKQTLPCIQYKLKAK